MKPYKKAYIEITNLCNLKCAFCPGTTRSGKYLSREEFLRILEEIRPFTDYIYLHLMGEPLMHPLLPDFIREADDRGFHVCITTNGVLLPQKPAFTALVPRLHKLSISLQAQEANEAGRIPDSYARDCFSFGKMLEGQTILVYRLWNRGGAEKNNPLLLEELKSFFPEPWTKTRGGFRIGDRVFLEFGDRFEWPDLSAKEQNTPTYFCYGLRDQFGILSDGSVVPCCLDHQGDLTLGNIFEASLGTILQGERACRIYEGFSRGEAAEELCRKCGYASRFGR